MELSDLRQKKTLLLGLGVNNRGLAAYLKQKGIDFDVIEKWRDHSELTEKVKSYDLVFRSPGLPYNSEPIQAALRKGAAVSSQTKLFFDLCPAKIIGVTGTKGKGTTATLIHNILAAAGLRAYLAGNIGRDPFEFIDELVRDDWVVLELSSFQLQDLHKSPHVAVVLKTTSEHLDHHRNRQEYVEAKINILAHQASGDFAVLNYDQETTRSFVDLTLAQIWWNSTENRVSPGSYAAGGEIFIDGSAGGNSIMKTSEVGLIGSFNLENITAAAAASYLAGATDLRTIKRAIADFKGLPHRLEFVREVAGVKFYNDSFSTIPEAAIAALGAFFGPVVLIAGGSAKGSNFEKLGEAVAGSKVKALLAVGAEGAAIVKASRKAGYAGKIYDSGLGDMKKIVSKANEIAALGDIVLLSPAAASFDMFADYKQRGELFKKYVNLLSVF